MPISAPIPNPLDAYVGDVRFPLTSAGYKTTTKKLTLHCSHGER